MKEEEINRYWKHIINTMNDGLMLIGPDGAIIMVNEAFERLSGYTSDEVIGRSCTLLQCDACEKAIEKEKHGWCTFFEKGEQTKNRCMIIRKNGTYLPVLKNASFLRDNEGIILGAVETLTDISELDRMDQDVDLPPFQRDTQNRFYGIIGKSPVMKTVFEVTQKSAQSDAPVIIYGESGTGKELVARAIHRMGRRKDGPFVGLNCAALNESLLESELFGHIKGAFSGAYRHRLGRFEAAHGGDFFLDEIGDVPLSIQVKLLRVLETKQFERVGDHNPITVDVRIITATNRNLEEMIALKKFREDLFFRINVIPICLPPLRDRKEDIPLLVTSFLENLQSRTGKHITGLTRETMDLFLAYPWPGNIRELKSALEYAFVIAEDGLIGREHLPMQIHRTGLRGAGQRFAGSAVEESQKTALISALRQSNGNQSRAARMLGVNRVTVWNRMRKYGIDVKKVLSSQS
jgi:two-component system, NtrC family, response regulator HydG